MSTINSLSCICMFLCVFLISSCEKSTVISEKEKEMEEIFVGAEGKYPGGWTSVTESTSFTNYPISGVFRYTNAGQTKMKGEFFATGAYKSCCDLENDGTMVFEIKNDSIMDWYFDDKIVDCEGVFRGGGVIESNGNMVITFTGDDCDGSHVGTITFRKQ